VDRPRETLREPDAALAGGVALGRLHRLPMTIKKLPVCTRSCEKTKGAASCVFRDISHLINRAAYSYPQRAGKNIPGVGACFFTSRACAICIRMCTAKRGV
jgi:hypothetical protein